MLPAPNRLPSPEIKRSLRSRNRVSVKELQIIFDKNKLAVSRFAVIISTKIDKRAVRRNRMRRLIHESVHHLLPTTAGGWDCVLIVQKNIAVDRQIDMETTMRLLFSKAGLTIF